MAGLRDEKANTFEEIASYNNYYEFGTGKGDPAENAHTLKTSPWSVQVSGEAARTGTFTLEDILQPHTLEERIYRLRCVEAWSMVIPWVGFPLADLLKRFEPTSQAKYVQFLTLNDRKQMPGVRYPVLEWPYREGLTIAEAMHPLTFVAVGLYGKVLPNQNGAPHPRRPAVEVRLQERKSIVRIHFTDTQPQTSWNMAAPNEYGFYSNVNPEVDHPRWSQATERRLGGGSALVGANSDADVQRLRRAGRQPLHGSRSRARTTDRARRLRMTQRWVVIVKTRLGRVLGAVRAARAASLRLRGRPRRKSRRANLERLRQNGAEPADVDALHHADSPLDGNQQARRVSPAARSVRVLLSVDCTF